MTKAGRVHKIPHSIWGNGPLSPRDAKKDKDATLILGPEKDKVTIIIPTQAGNATFERFHEDAHLIRWRSVGGGTAERTEEYPVKLSSFHMAEELYKNYLRSEGIIGEDD